MVYMVFVEEKPNGDVIYRYMPEKQDAASGIVSVNRHTRERRLLEKSPAGSWSAYHGQAWKRIDQMLDDGMLKAETYSAWY